MIFEVFSGTDQIPKQNNKLLCIDIDGKIVDPELGKEEKEIFIFDWTEKFKFEKYNKHYDIEKGKKACQALKEYIKNQGFVYLG